MHSQFVSVIIPVFNDATRLRVCLNALENQTYPKYLYEVIVVDNGSHEVENVRDVVDQFGQANITQETTPGSYAARNKGISLAKGAVLAFTDADCIPAPDWIEQGVKHLQQLSNCGMVAGKIEIFCKNPDSPTPVELYERITAFPQQRLLEQHHYGATGNLFTFKRVMDDIGLFNPQLKSNGDVDWGQRVFQRGYGQIYADNLWVQHPARYSFAELYKRTLRLVGGQYDLQQVRYQPLLISNLLFLVSLIKNLVPPLMFVVNAFLNPQLKGFKQKFDTSCVMFFVRYVSAWEMMCLKMGKVSSRE